MQRSKMIKKEREATSELAKLTHESEYIRGNLVTMARVCGNPNCKCARGEKHVSLYLSIKKGGKQKMIYIPRDWEDTVKRWVKRYHRIKYLLEKVSEINRDRLVKRKRKKRR